MRAETTNWSLPLVSSNSTSSHSEKPNLHAYVEQGFLVEIDTDIGLRKYAFLFVLDLAYSSFGPTIALITPLTTYFPLSLSSLDDLEEPLALSEPVYLDACAR